MQHSGMMPTPIFRSSSKPRRSTPRYKNAVRGSSEKRGTEPAKKVPGATTFQPLRFRTAALPKLACFAVGEFGRTDILASNLGCRPPLLKSANYCKLAVQTEGGHSRK
jgi:hypothetical protein